MNAYSRLKRFSAAAMLGLLLLLTPATVMAKDLFTEGSGGIDCGTAATHSAVCAEHSTTENPLAETIRKIADIVAFIAGAAAVILIIVSGIRYMMADGDAGKISSAKATLTGAIIGLIIIGLSRALISFVVKSL